MVEEKVKKEGNVALWPLDVVGGEKAKVKILGPAHHKRPKGLEADNPSSHHQSKLDKQKQKKH